MVIERLVEAISQPDPVTQSDLTLVYSDTGSVNRGNPQNYVILTPLASSRITALASAPAGLLVFLEHETFLVRGDPALGDLAVQRLTGTLGCDLGVIPGRLGSTVLPIYGGEVYAVSLGGGDVDFGGDIQNLSLPVWDAEDAFVQVIGEPSRNQVVARTSAGRVFRYSTRDGKWFNDPFDEVSGLEGLLPARVPSSYGVRYLVGGNPQVVSAGVSDAASVSFSELDFGDKNLMKLFRRVEVFTPDASVGEVPSLAYDTRGASGSVSGQALGEGRWVFTLPRGLVGPTISLVLEFGLPEAGLVVEPPVAIEFARRYRQR